MIYNQPTVLANTRTPVWFLSFNLLYPRPFPASTVITQEREHAVLLFLHLVFQLHNDLWYHPCSCKCQNLNLIFCCHALLPSFSSAIALGSLSTSLKWEYHLAMSQEYHEAQWKRGRGFLRLLILLYCLDGMVRAPANQGKISNSSVGSTYQNCTTVFTNGLKRKQAAPAYCEDHSQQAVTRLLWK